MCLPSTCWECLPEGASTATTWRAGSDQARRIDYVAVPAWLRDTCEGADETHRVDALHDIEDHCLAVVTVGVAVARQEVMSARTQLPYDPARIIDGPVKEAYCAALQRPPQIP
eukprot:13457057-Alexandrium_andersonii.AAC.1